MVRVMPATTEVVSFSPSTTHPRTAAMGAFIAKEFRIGVALAGSKSRRGSCPQEDADKARQDERKSIAGMDLLPRSGCDHIDNKQAAYEDLAHLIEGQCAQMASRSSRDEARERPADSSPSAASS